MTEDEARAALRDFDGVGGLEHWIAGRLDRAHRPRRLALPARADPGWPLGQRHSTRRRSAGGLSRARTMTRPGWLPQMHPSDGAVRVQDYPFKVVSIACRHCPRAGRYRRAKLAERFGPAAGLPEVEVLAADCPKRGIGQFSDPCGARFPDLPSQG